ncbi:MAG: hypothetical protein DWQ10_01300 [Calditrichaeota bacterium]|nr:MAG: hypothetical protein DWQ10_01300 [Calditrichota bacterium]
MAIISKILHNRKYIFLTVIFFTSCYNPFSPTLDQSDEDVPFITNQETPEEFFANFRYAYVFKDSLVYSNLLDSSFTFQYFNPDIGESGAFDSWRRNTELTTTGRLLRSFETIDLTWYRIFFENDIDESEKKIYRDFRLMLVNGDENISLFGSALFTLVKTQDGKWRIKLWVDETNY